jgi:hypothetical protein
VYFRAQFPVFHHEVANEDRHINPGNRGDQIVMTANVRNYRVPAVLFRRESRVDASKISALSGNRV